MSRGPGDAWSVQLICVACGRLFEVRVSKEAPMVGEVERCEACTGRLAATGPVQPSVIRWSRDMTEDPLGSDEGPAPCGCEWCRVSPYRRLWRAWREASPLEREQFALEAKLGEPPF